MEGTCSSMVRRQDLCHIHFQLDGSGDDADSNDAHSLKILYPVRLA